MANAGCYQVTMNLSPFEVEVLKSLSAATKAARIQSERIALDAEARGTFNYLCQTKATTCKTVHANLVHLLNIQPPGASISLGYDNVELLRLTLRLAQGIDLVSARDLRRECQALFDHIRRATSSTLSNQSEIERSLSPQDFYLALESQPKNQSRQVDVVDEKDMCLKTPPNKSLARTRSCIDLNSATDMEPPVTPSHAQKINFSRPFIQSLPESHSMPFPSLLQAQSSTQAYTQCRPLSAIMEANESLISVIQYQASSNDSCTGDTSPFSSHERTLSSTPNTQYTESPASSSRVFVEKSGAAKKRKREKNKKRAMHDVCDSRFDALRDAGFL